MDKKYYILYTPEEVSEVNTIVSEDNISDYLAEVIRDTEGGVFLSCKFDKDKRVAVVNFTFEDEEETYSQSYGFLDIREWKKPLISDKTRRWFKKRSGYDLENSHDIYELEISELDKENISLLDKITTR